MALLDVNLLFFHTGTAFAFTAGEYVSLVQLGTGGVGSTCASTTIDLTKAMDMGVGPGEFVPKIALALGSTITSACASTLLNFQLQGLSTSGGTWITLAETGTQTGVVATNSASASTTSFVAGTSSFSSAGWLMPFDIPKRPPGQPLMRFLRVLITITGNANSEGLSGGSLIGGIIISARGDWDDTGGKYSAGFTAV